MLRSHSRCHAETCLVRLRKRWAWRNRGCPSCGLTVAELHIGKLDEGARVLLWSCSSWSTVGRADVACARSIVHVQNRMGSHF